MGLLNREIICPNCSEKLDHNYGGDVFCPDCEVVIECDSDYTDEGDLIIVPVSFYDYNDI